MDYEVYYQKFTDSVKNDIRNCLGVFLGVDDGEELKAIFRYIVDKNSALILEAQQSFGVYYRDMCEVQRAAQYFVESDDITDETKRALATEALKIIEHEEKFINAFKALTIGLTLALLESK